MSGGTHGLYRAGSGNQRILKIFSRRLLHPVDPNVPISASLRLHPPNQPFSRSSVDLSDAIDSIDSSNEIENNECIALARRGFSSVKHAESDNLRSGAQMISVMPMPIGRQQKVLARAARTARRWSLSLTDVLKKLRLPPCALKLMNVVLSERRRSSSASPS